MITILQPKFDQKILDNIIKQDYSANKSIAGVRVAEIKHFSTEDGYFMELIRLEQGIIDSFKAERFEAKQINIAKSSSKTVKAWHIHYHQEDVWFIPPDSKLLVGLVDLRKDSETKDQQMRLILGEGKSKLLYIPRGVAHGYANFSEADSYIIYFVNNYFNPEKSDENRLAWDYFGQDFWAITKE